MLTFLNLTQLVLYIACLSLLGQGLLYLLAGARREKNLFYQLLRIVGKPFTWLVRRLTPPQVSDERVPVVAFFVLVVLYAIVTFEKIDRCVAAGMQGCR